MFLYDPKEIETSPEVKLEPWRQNLLNSAQYIRDHGWYQGGLCDPSRERVCIIGSLYAGIGLLNAAAEKSPFLQKKVTKEWDKIVGYMGKNTSTFCLATWNDKKGRTAEEVIAVLEGAARS